METVPEDEAFLMKNGLYVLETYIRDESMLLVMNLFEHAA